MEGLTMTLINFGENATETAPESSRQMTRDKASVAAEDDLLNLSPEIPATPQFKLRLTPMRGKKAMSRVVRSMTNSRSDRSSVRHLVGESERRSESADDRNARWETSLRHSSGASTPGAHIIFDATRGAQQKHGVEMAKPLMCPLFPDRLLSSNRLERELSPSPPPGLDMDIGRRLALPEKLDIMTGLAPPSPPLRTHRKASESQEDELSPSTPSKNRKKLIILQQDMRLSKTPLTMIRRNLSKRRISIGGGGWGIPSPPILDTDTEEEKEGSGKDKEIVLRSSELDPTVHQIKIPPATDFLMYARICALMERYNCLLETQAKKRRRWFDFSALVGIDRKELESMYMKGIGSKTKNSSECSSPSLLSGNPFSSPSKKDAPNGAITTFTTPSTNSALLLSNMMAMPELGGDKLLGNIAIQTTEQGAENIMKTTVPAVAPMTNNASSSVSMAFGSSPVLSSIIATTSSAALPPMGGVLSEISLAPMSHNILNGPISLAQTNGNPFGSTAPQRPVSEEKTRKMKPPPPSIIKSLLECADDLVVEEYFSETIGDELEDTSSMWVQATVFSSQRQRQFIVCHRSSVQQQEKPVKANAKQKESTGEPSLLHRKHPFPINPAYRDTYFASNLEVKVFALLEKLTAANPFCDVIYTGHSFGGALSIIGAARFAALNQMMTVSCIAYGVPKVGGLDFRHFVNSLPNLKMMRVEHGQDPYAHLPEGPKWHHVGHTIAMNSFQESSSGGASTSRSLTAKDILTKGASNVGAAKDLLVKGASSTKRINSGTTPGKGYAHIPLKPVNAYKFDKRPSGSGHGGIHNHNRGVLDQNARAKKVQRKADHEMRAYSYGLEQFTHFGLPWVSDFVGEDGEGIVSDMDHESRHVV